MQIVGGNVTSIYDYPWTALLRYHNERKQQDSWGCSGSYIGWYTMLYINKRKPCVFSLNHYNQTGGRTVVTAAHCVDEVSKRDLGKL